MVAGGAERQASFLCNHWAQSGRDVVLATLFAEPSHYDLHKDIVLKPFRHRRRPGLHNHWNDLLSMRRLIAEEQPEVVLAFIDAMNIKVLAAAIGGRVPVIVSERSIPASLASTYPTHYGVALGLARRVFYPSAAALVVQTEPIAHWARRQHLSRNITVIPNVIEPLYEHETDSPRNSKVVLSVGRLSREKGHDILIRAFAGVADKFPDWRLRIVGDGILRSELSGLIESLGLQRRVELAPTKKSLVMDYRTAGIFVLPSRFEGFPNALMEAMQSGCPVVSANCPVGPAEILSDGSDGLLFRNEDASGLASQLTILMQDGELRRSLGERARETVRKYEPEVVLPIWDRLLDGVIMQRRVRGG
jgi:glycosyltransferase involved in cell wall biosynthesis